MRKLVTFVLAVSALAAPAGGSGFADGSRSRLIAKPTQYGRILFDGRGYVLYGFTRDPRGKSVCAGACAKAWPPYVVRARPRAGRGVAGALIGTTKRRDGSLQATYRGHPLYYYVGDRKPGQILCQNVQEFGGLWLVVRPTGQLVR